MDNTDLGVDEIVKLAVAAGRRAAERTPADAFKATERRLYALPILREKLERDRERMEELTTAARAELEAVIAAGLRWKHWIMPLPPASRMPTTRP